jgi:CHAD domain-containing protein
MAYKLQSEEPISEGVRRIAREQLEKAIAQLNGETEDGPDEAVHDVRKRLKKLRALLRLVRDEVGSKTYKQENACFRDAGRQLSDVRDAQVRIETLDKLVKHFSDTIAPTAFQSVREILEKRYELIQQEARQDNSAQITVVPILQAALDRVETWPITHNNWSALEGGLKWVYQCGSQNFLMACDRPTAEHLHEWRKRVKDLWYHLCILKPIWPDFLSELSDQLKVLADDLGDDHDLAVLGQFMTENPELFAAQEQLNILSTLIQQRQQQLQTHARFLGQRIYAEKPKAFVKRMEAYWQTWQAEVQQRQALYSIPSQLMNHLPAIEAL